MQVVNGVAPVVLNVPAEAGEAHPNIHPWNLDGIQARNLDVIMTQSMAPQCDIGIQVTLKSAVIAYVQETQ